MAKGIDSAAHIGTIMGKGKTIAVLGSGFKHIYPKENMELLKDIINSGGAVITEYEEDTLPKPEKFSKKKQEISALSQGVVVVESGKEKRKLNHSRTCIRRRKRSICCTRKYNIKNI